ncbi:MAG: hypothetical protein SGBAC_010768 [Bacillariaceae sp.]
MFALDVTLETFGDISPSQVFLIAQAIQEKLVPPLLGCADAIESRRKLETIRGGTHDHSRQLDVTGTNKRYFIANAFVLKAKEIQQACTETDFPALCHKIFVELTVFLKDAIRLLDIIFLISEEVGELLKESGVNDNNLKGPLRLEYPIFNVQLVQINAVTPTQAPSMVPTNVASVSPSSSPSARPVVGASPPPTAMPIDV